MINYKKVYTLLIFVMSALFARECVTLQTADGETQWCYDQSTQQSFYMFQMLSVDGGDVDQNDVLGAFVTGAEGEDVCIGFIAANPTDPEVAPIVSENGEGGYTTLPLNGNDGSFPDYPSAGDIISDIRLFDASNGTIISLSPSSELPGWGSNEIHLIVGTSNANNNLGCTDSEACNYTGQGSTGIGNIIDDGSCTYPEENFDCDGNCTTVIDCAGVCGGSSENDVCGVCDGPGLNDDGCCGEETTDCNGDCGGTASLDSCDVCSGGNSGHDADSDQDICGVCFGDDSSCTGCSDPIADNTGEGCEENDGVCTQDDGSCTYTVPGVTNIAAEAGQGRVEVSWDAPEQMGNAAYTYTVSGNGVEDKQTSSTSAMMTGLTAGEYYCFSVTASNIYGTSEASELACATPEAEEGMSWGFQISASAELNNQTWYVEDLYSKLGTAGSAAFGNDQFDLTNTPPSPNGDFIDLYFPHPEWEGDSEGLGLNYAQDAVPDDLDYFDHNLVAWDFDVHTSDVGNGTLEFIKFGAFPQNLNVYLEEGGNYTSISNGDSYAFNIDDSGINHFSLYIGNIVPQAPQGVSASGGDRQIAITGSSDGGDLNDIRNRYPATSFNIYRDGEPNDIDANLTSDHVPGGAGLIAEGLESLDFTDNEDIYDLGEGLLYESTYTYTVTGSNSAGESSEGHTVTHSGGATEFFSGRDTRVSATTDDNIDPVSVPACNDSDGGTNVGDCHYEVAHDGLRSTDDIDISLNGDDSDDSDENDRVNRYTWDLVGADGWDDLSDVQGEDESTLSFYAHREHDEGTKTYKFNLLVESDYPIKASGEGGQWTHTTATRSNEESITITIDEEPNTDPIAVNDIVAGDGFSVETQCEDSVDDGNDYDADSGDWYIPHDGNPDTDDASASFSGSNSSDEDGDAITYSWTLDGIEGSTDNSFSDNLLEGDYLVILTVTDSYGDSHSASLDVSVLAERNNHPTATGALAFIVVGDSLSVSTMQDYSASDVNDYDLDAQLWYVPHDGTPLTNEATLDFDGGTSFDSDCDDFEYAWYLDAGVAVSDFDCFDDLNGDGDYDLGEPIWSCPIPDDYTIDGSDVTSSTSKESYELPSGVYLVRLEVTDSYDTSDHSDLFVGVEPERNAAPTASIDSVTSGEGNTSSSPQKHYMPDTQDVKSISMTDHSVSDPDGDVLAYSWTYNGTTQSSTSGETPAYPSLDNDQDLAVGSHTFTLTVTDNYGASSSASFDVNVLDEPEAPQASISTIAENLYYTIVEVSEGTLDASITDSDTYTGDAQNTYRMDLHRGDGTYLATWTKDSDGWSVEDLEYTDSAASEFTYVDQSVSDNTEHTYTVTSYNSDDRGQMGALSTNSTTATTGIRPTVEVLNPNGGEIASVGDLYDVEYSTTENQYISKIEVFYLADGETESEGVNQSGDVQSIIGSANNDGQAIPAEPAIFSISDNTGSSDTVNDISGINHSAKVRVRITDIGDYNGNNANTNSDDSDLSFTMSNHELSRNFSRGWHLVGTPLDVHDAGNNNIYDNSGLIKDNFSGLGTYGSDWVAFESDGAYENLHLNVGQGYWLGLADDNSLSLTGDPVIGDPEDGSLFDIELDRGWNLISHPLTTYSIISWDDSRLSFTNEDSGETKSYFGAVIADWVSIDILQWIPDGPHAEYEEAEVLRPFDGAWIYSKKDHITAHITTDDNETFEDHLSRDTQGPLAKALDKVNGLYQDADNLWAMGLSVQDQFGRDDQIVVGLTESINELQSLKLMNPSLPDMLTGESVVAGNASINSQFSKDVRSRSRFSEVWTEWNLDLSGFEGELTINAEFIGGNDDVYLVIDNNPINITESFTINNLATASIVVGDISDYMKPSEFALKSAYPNPFNPTTSLELSIVDAGLVNVSIFNVLGQKVDELVNSYMDAGYHTMVWDAGSFSSGMYFVKVNAASGDVAVQKIMLIK